VSASAAQPGEGAGVGCASSAADGPAPLDPIDRALLADTQGGLPLDPRPFAVLARRHGLAEHEVLARFRRLLASGVVRRIAAVPNHYALGYRSNAMTVWDVADRELRAAGTEIGALPFVSHCYHRPRRPPDWPYNLFAMVHGRDRAAVEGQIARIAERLGARARAHEVLYSSRILKKRGARIRAAARGEG